VWVNGFDVFQSMTNKKPTRGTFTYIDINAIDNSKNRIVNPKVLDAIQAPSRASREVRSGDTLFSMVRPYLMNIAYVDSKYDNSIASTGFFVCRPYKLLLQKYIFYLMLSPYVVYGLNSYMKGDNSPSINNDDILNYQYPIPPLFEQYRIVDNIERLFELVDVVEDNKLSLEQFIAQSKSKVLDLAIHGRLVPQDPEDEPASILLERINIGKKSHKVTTDKSHYNKLPKGWINVQLEDVFKITMGQSPKGTSISNNSTGTEFHQGKTFFTDKYLAGSNLYTSSPTKVIQGPCVLLCVRAPVGVVNISNNTICIGRGLCAITPMKNVSVDFVYYWIKTLEQSFVEKSTGSTFQSISMNTVKKSVISFPPLAEQQRIVSQIERIFAQLDIIEDSLKA